jgi:hypothetical protein
MKTIGMLPLKTHLFFNKVLFMHKVVNGQTPLYLKTLFRETPSPYSLFRRNLSCPKPRVDIYKTSISYAGSLAWNSLPQNLKSIFKPSSFKIQLLKYLHSASVQGSL